jgi:DNA-binding transcriptional ArsR family regulator
MNAIDVFALNGNGYREPEIPDIDPPMSMQEVLADNAARVAAMHARDERIREYERVQEARRAETEEKRRRAKRALRQQRKEAWWARALFTNGYKIFAYEYFTRAIRGHLTPAEQAVFFLIFDRTVWWLKEWETIRLSQFIGGSLPDEDGFRAFSGTGLSRRTVISTLQRLEADGLVRRREKRGGNGLVEYALPEVHRVRELPRFAGVNIAYRGWMFTERGARVQVTL